MVDIEISQEEADVLIQMPKYRGSMTTHGTSPVAVPPLISRCCRKTNEIILCWIYGGAGWN